MNKYFLKKLNFSDSCNLISAAHGLFLLGVRKFTPSSAADGFLYVGGPAVVLSLVAMAPDDSSLYAAVKVLLSVLETNSAMQQEMDRINGYKVCQTMFKIIGVALYKQKYKSHCS